MWYVYTFYSTSLEPTLSPLKSGELKALGDLTLVLNDGSCNGVDGDAAGSQEDYNAAESSDIGSKKDPRL